jgi:hypothetical protein
MEFYTRSYQCLVNTSIILNRYEEASDAFSDPSVSTYRAWLEMTLTIGNTSLWYKNCYLNTQVSLMNFYYYVMEYESLSNYILYFLPNLLSYAFVINTWLDKMDALRISGNTTGLYYYYGLIIRNVFFFPMPEASSFSPPPNTAYDNYLLYENPEKEETQKFIAKKLQSVFKTKFHRALKDVNPHFGHEEWEETVFYSD